MKINITSTKSGGLVTVTDGEKILLSLATYDRAEAGRIGRIIAARQTVCTDPDGKLTQCGYWGVTGDPRCYGHKVSGADFLRYLGGEVAV